MSEFNDPTDDEELTSDEVAEVAKRARAAGVTELLVEAVERVAERMKRRESASTAKAEGR